MNLLDALNEAHKQNTTGEKTEGAVRIAVTGITAYIERNAQRDTFSMYVQNSSIHDISRQTIEGLARNSYNDFLPTLDYVRRDNSYTQDMETK